MKANYKIRVKGHFEVSEIDGYDQVTADWTDDPNGEPVTSFTILFQDQAEMRGYLNQLWDLNLEILYLSVVTDGS